MTVKYIIGHWSAGAGTPNKTDLNSYQLLIDNKAGVYHGRAVGKAASTGGMNSITFNISCCGGGQVNLTRVQIERFYFECAKYLKLYGLGVNKFYTHAEIGEMCRNKTITKLLPYNKWLYQNIGKIDLTVLPVSDKDLRHKFSAFESGDFIRKKILWYYN